MVDDKTNDVSSKGTYIILFIIFIMIVVTIVMSYERHKSHDKLLALAINKNPAIASKMIDAETIGDITNIAELMVET